MITYSVFIIFIAILLIANSYIKTTFNLFALLAIISIIFFVGFRFETGYDWVMYRNFFENDYFHGSIEFGYVYLIKALRAFFDNFQSLFFASAFLTYVFLFLGIKKYTTHIGIALFIFLLIPGFFLNTLTIMRQELAISIALYAFYFLLQRRFIPYLVLMFLAFSAHYSVLIVLVAHIIIWKFADKVPVKSYYWLIILSIPFTLVDIGSIMPVLFSGSRYEFYESGESVSLIKTVVLNGLAFFYLSLMPKLKDKNELNVYVIAMFVAGIVFTNVFSSVIALSRIGYYFRLYEIILVAELIFIFSKQSRLIVLASLTFFYSALFYNALVVDMAETRTENNLIPYKNIFTD